MKNVAICQPQSRLNMIPPLVMNLVTDACIMAIPVPVVLLVRTTFWKRAGLIFLFSAGIFIMVAAILRVTMVLIVDPPQKPYPLNRYLTPSARNKTAQPQQSGLSAKTSLPLLWVKLCFCVPSLRKASGLADTKCQA